MKFLALLGMVTFELFIGLAAILDVILFIPMMIWNVLLCIYYSIKNRNIKDTINEVFKTMLAKVIINMQKVVYGITMVIDALEDES